MASSGGGDAGGGAKCKRKQAFLAMADDDGGNDRNNNSSNNHPNNENDDVEEVDDLVADLRAEMKGAGTAASAIRERSTSFSAEDYESVSSPGGSSTASGPTYIRPAGFDHHAQEILAPKQQQQHQQQSSSSQQQPMGCVGSSLVSPPPPSVRSVLSRHSFSGPTGTGALAPSSGPGSRSTAKKKKTLLSADFADKRLEGVVRPKTRKDPLPMKQRALPQSFWQQPNAANPQPPGVICSALPPLGVDPDATVGCVGASSSNNHLTPVEEVGGGGAASRLSAVTSANPTVPGATASERSSVVSVANTDLLFSLFNAVEEEEAQRRIHVVRRGRPKKSQSTSNLSSLRSSAPRDDDPCLNSAAADSILPLIPDNGAGGGDGKASKGSQGTQVIKIMSISHGDRSVELPSLNVEHNYPHLLSELVMKL